MSTRCTIHFERPDGNTAAIVYRHSDGYPEAVLPDLARFFADVQDQCDGDTRFGDPSYLAAKFVVWQAGEYARYGNGNPLSFLSVGVVLDDPFDIEYRYHVRAIEWGAEGTPEVTYDTADLSRIAQYVIPE